MKKYRHLIITFFISLICFLVSPLIYNQPFVKNNIYVNDNDNKLPEQIISDNILLKPEDDNLRIMTLNLLVHYSSWGGTSVNERKDIFFDLVNGYAPDVIGLQEMCNDWYGEIKRNVNSYEFASPLTTAFPQKMTAILYNKNSVELIDSGSIAFSNSVNFKSRRVAWALFKSKTTGEVFCVVNTHLSYLTEAKKEENFFTQTRQVNELYSITEKLYSQYNSPVIIIGDFNTKKRGSYDKSVILAGSYGILNSLYTDAEDIAQNKYNGENLGYKNTLNDHIFIKGYIKIKNLSILSQEAFSSLSDHYPLMADIILKNNP